MTQLQLLRTSTSGRKIEIIKTIAPMWYHFGDQLNFDSNSRLLNVIQKKHQGDPLSGCKEMFHWWLNGCGRGDQPVNWRTLAKLLEDSGYGHLAHDIRRHF